MIVDTISLHAQKGTQVIRLNVCAVTSNAIPTFRFVPHDKGCSSPYEEITATFNFGRWVLNCSNWTVDKEDVRKYCKEVLQQRMEKLPAGEWFEKHTAVADEDFIKEPHRNKLNIILTRTTHLQYHIGQLILLK